MTQAPALAQPKPSDRHALGERLFGYSAAGALAFEVAFVGAVCIALIVYVDAKSFLQAILAQETLFAVKLTLATVTISTAISMLLAIPAAYALSHYRIPFASAIDTLLDLPKDGIRDSVASRGLGDVYKRQNRSRSRHTPPPRSRRRDLGRLQTPWHKGTPLLRARDRRCSKSETSPLTSVNSTSAM